MRYSYDLFVEELGAKLKQMRKDRGWTLRDMVVDHHLHLTQWQRLESGKGVSTPSLLRICEVFDVGLAQLVGELGQVEAAAEVPTDASKDVAKPKRLPAKLAKGTKKTATSRPGQDIPWPSDLSGHSSS